MVDSTSSALSYPSTTPHESRRSSRSSRRLRIAGAPAHASAVTKGPRRVGRGALGITYTDEDLLTFVLNVYAVLLTRGVRGTYVYVCDGPLRERLRPFFSATVTAPPETANRSLQHGVL